jgi:putative redox protein
MTSRNITFENSRGLDLSARIDLPADERPIAYALFAHCFTCSKNLAAVDRLSRSLTDRGFAVMRFDFTGLGQSAGEFRDTDFSSNISDIGSAAAFLADRFEGPAILIGHSLGGAAVLHAAAGIDSVRAVCTIGAPYDPAHVRELFSENEDEIEREGKATVNIGGRPFTIRKEFIDDLEAADPERVIGDLGRALLVMHAPMDEVVGIGNAADIFMAAKHPKSFISLDTADHLLTGDRDAMYAGSVLAAWSERYLDTERHERASIESDEHRATVQIGRDRYRTEIISSGHPIVADEPREKGGTNEGPSPYDLLLASLGSCTAITLRMYADRKEWDLDRVTVRLDHDKVHADDCDCEAPEGINRVDVIERQMTFEGDLTREQRQRLLEIANKCPVHRTMEGHIVVKSSLTDE